MMTIWINYTALGHSEPRLYSVPLTRKLRQTFANFNIILSEDTPMPLENSEVGVIIHSLTDKQIKCWNNPNAEQ